MRTKIILEPVILFLGTLMLVNLLIFLPSQYSIHFQTNICDNVSSEDFQVDNLPRSSEYYQKSCNSIFSAWRYVMTPPIKLKYHVIPLIVAILVTAPLVYYRLLESEFNRKGVQNWDERKP